MKIDPRIRLLIAVYACFAFMTGCKKSDMDISDSATPVLFYTTDNWSDETSTRTITDESGTHFVKGDKIGVYAYYLPEGMEEKRQEFMFNQLVEYIEKNGNLVWDYSPVKYWPTMTVDRLEFMAYYPYGTDEVQVTRENSKLKFEITPAYNTDLLIVEPTVFAKPDKGGTVPLHFKHLLSRVNVTIKHASDKFPTQDKLYVKSIIFNSYPTSKTITLDGGALLETTVDSNHAITPDDFLHEVTGNKTEILSRYVLPGNLQNLSVKLASGTLEEDEITLQVGENGKGIDIEAGSVLTLNITISVTGVSVSVVNGWIQENSSLVI